MNSFFKDTDFDQIKNKTILLDIDGTLVSDGSLDLEELVVKKLEALAKKNEIYLCSNKKDHSRNEQLAKKLGFHYLRSNLRKPNKKLLSHIPERTHGSFCVIGDKYFTDGRFAKRIGCDFIKVRSIVSKKDPWWVKLTYTLDAFLYSFL